MNRKIKSSISFLFILAISTFNSTAAIVSVDIDQYDYTNPTFLAYYRYRVLNEPIVSTPFTSSPNNALAVSELDVTHRIERTGGLSSNRGVYVDLQENTQNSNLIEIFLRPMVGSASVHQLGITIDFELDPGQIIESIEYQGGNLWGASVNQSLITHNYDTSGDTSIFIDYTYTVTSGNVNGVMAFNTTTSFDRYTIRLVTPVVVPEPSAIALLGIGSLVLLRRKRP
jgi:hypothetical protein